MRSQVWVWTLLGVACASVACSHGAASLPERADDLAVAVAAQNPLPGIEPPTAAEKGWHGRVDEVVRAGSYTYLRVACDDEVERWVVTLRSDFAIGARVTIKNMGTRRDFRSKRLARTFERLVFGIVHDETPHG